MADQPTEVPEWATTGTKTEPSAGSKLTGFIAGTKWAAQHGNWLLNTIYLWLNWIYLGLLTRSSLTDDTPIFQTTDQDANVKSWLDANGYTFGAVLSGQYFWRHDTSYSAAETVSHGDVQFATIIDAGFSVQGANPPSSEIGAAMLKIQCQTGPTTGNGAIVSCDDGTSVGDNRVFTNLDDAIAVFECTFITEEAASSSSDFFMGFYEPDTDPATLLSGGNDGVGFHVAATGTVFQGLTADSTSLSTVTTGTTCAVDTLYHLRVEHHGAATPKGVDNSNASLARFFIDGVMVLEKTTVPVLDAAWLGPCIMATGSTGGGTTHFKYVGPVHWSVNYVPSSQVPDAV